MTAGTSRTTKNRKAKTTSLKDVDYDAVARFSLYGMSSLLRGSLKHLYRDDQKVRSVLYHDRPLLKVVFVRPSNQVGKLYERIVPTSTSYSHLRADTDYCLSKKEVYDPSTGPSFCVQWCTVTKNIVGLDYDFSVVLDDEPVRENSGIKSHFLSSHQKLKDRYKERNVTIVVDTHGRMVYSPEELESYICRLAVGENVKYATIILCGIVRKDDSSDDDEIVDAYLDEDTTGAYSGITFANSKIAVIVTTGKLSSVSEFYRTRLRLTDRQIAKRVIERMTKSLRDSLPSLERRRERIEKQLIKNAARIANVQRQIALVDNDSNIDFVTSQVSRLHQVAGVESVVFERGSIIATTTDFYYEPDSRLFAKKYLGKFRIEIDLVKWNTHVTNLAQKTLDQPSFTAQTSFGACLGSFATIFSSAIRSADYSALLSALVEYIREAHLNDTSCRLRYNLFPEEKPKQPVVGPRRLIISYKDVVDIYKVDEDDSSYDDDVDDDDDGTDEARSRR